MITELTKENFNEFINTEHINVVKIGAEWCGPCKMVSPILESVSDTTDESEIRMGDIDSDKQFELAKELNIRSIPTTIFYKNGMELKRRIGQYTESDLNNMLVECKKIRA